RLGGRRKTGSHQRLARHNPAPIWLRSSQARRPLQGTQRAPHRSRRPSSERFDRLELTTPVASRQKAALTERSRRLRCDFAAYRPFLGGTAMKTVLTHTIVLALFASLSFAADSSPWPRFRGPDGSGVAKDAKPPTEIGPETNVKWKIAVPSGLSSP